MPASVGLICIDLDPGHDEVWAAEHLPPTLTVKSPRGRHLYYRCNDRFGNSVLGPHIDTRNAGGYSILPPSRLADGGTYEWFDEREPVALPEDIRGLLQAKREYDSRPYDPNTDDGDDSPGKLAQARTLLKNTDPHDGGYKIACRLRRDIGLSFDAAVEVFAEWSDKLDWPWNHEKIRSVCRNAGRYGNGATGQFSGAGVDAYREYLILNGINPDDPIFLLKPPHHKQFTWRTPEEAASAPPIGYWDEQKSLPKVAGILVVSGPQKSHKTGLIIKKCLDALDRGARILYVAAEGGFGIDTARLPRAREQRGWEWGKLNSKWITLATPFNILVQTPSLVEEALFTPDIVVFDTLTRVAGSADLNTSQAVQQIYSACDRLMEAWNCLVILIHHPKRDGKGASGSVQIENSAYATWHVSLENETDVLCWVDKMKDGEAEFEIRYMADMSRGAPVILDAKRRERSVSTVRYQLEQALTKVPAGQKVNIEWMANATGLSIDTIEAHVRGRKDKKGVFRKPDCADLCAGEFFPKIVKTWEFLGLGVQ